MSLCSTGTHTFAVSERCVEDLLSVGNSGHCRFAELRQAAGAGSWAALKGKRVFIAVTFHNNQALLPSFFFELLRLVLTLREAFGAKVFVSVYESGSTDLSAFELIQCRLLFDKLGVEHELVTHGLTRGLHDHRIDFLAKVRNLSLKRLLVEGKAEYDTVLFFNDVYFCVESALDVLLLRTGTPESGRGADMVCSADFNRNDRGELAFYDIWVSRDLHGRKFRNLPPFIALEESWQRFEARVPVPVFSCWGGMAAVAASVFTEHNIRFRRNFPTECAASECELLCRDMWAVNKSTILLLPTAIAAYSHDVFVSAQQKYSRPSEPLLELPERVPWPVSVECCPLEDACDSIVDFSNCVEDNVSWFNHLYGVPSSPGGLQPARLPGPLNPGTASMQDVVKGLQPAACPELPDKKIPRRIVQTWRTNKPAEVRQHVWFLALSWVLRHPCYDYQLVTDDDIEPIIRDHELYPLWKSISVRGMKNDFGRYLYLQQVGGIYADLDTYAARSLEELIGSNDEFVVGLEAAFAKEADAIRWAYAVPTSASLHCWATSPNSEVLATVLAEVSRRLNTPTEVYKKLLAYGRGSPSFLETLFTTGPGPFTEAVLKGSPSHLVRLLDIHAFSGGHSAGEEFYRLQNPKHMKNRTVYVEHRNFGSWVPKRHVQGVETGFHYLPANVPMLSGEWFYAAEVAGMAMGKPTWSSVEASVISLARRFGGGAPFFLWMSPVDEMGVSCLQVMKGLGPRDPANKSLWKVCWDADAQEEATYLWLHPDGALNVYTATRSWCACEPPSPPKMLWSSGSGKDGQASVLLLSKAGVLSVFQFTSGYALHRAVASLGLDATSSQLSKWKIVLDARGSCGDEHTLPRAGRETADNLEEAIRNCEEETLCEGFTYALPTAPEARKGLWMCTKPMSWGTSAQWVTVSRDLPEGTAGGPALSACFVAHVDHACDKHLNEWEKALLRMRFC